MNKLLIALIGSILLASAVAQGGPPGKTCPNRNIDALKNCWLCNEENTACAYCQPGSSFIKDATTCTQCTVSHCAECESDAGTCDKCMEGYFIKGSGSSASCSPCGSNCLTCTDASTCDAKGFREGCKEGYDISTATPGTCTACPSNCDGCNGDKNGDCTACKAGYALANKACKETCTIEGCLACATSRTTCDACNPVGYYETKTNDVVTACNACADGCFWCDSATTCQVCNEPTDLLSADQKTCIFGYKTTASFALIAAAILSFVF